MLPDAQMLDDLKELDLLPDARRSTAFLRCSQTHGNGLEINSLLHSINLCVLTVKVIQATQSTPDEAKEIKHHDT
jgi:hypothetical protein